MIFDVLQWPFFVLPAPLALSLYWVSLFASGLFGWRVLLAKLGVRVWLSWIGAFLLLFNAYQQSWLTVLGINLLLMPLICLSVITNSNTILNFVLPFIVGAVVLSATSYIPGIVSILYGVVCLSLIQIVSKKLQFRNFISKFAMLGLGMLSPVILRYDEFKVLTETVYPGQRWGSGGGMPISLWLSQFFPTMVFNGWQDLLNLNTCEASSVGTFLPVFVILYTLCNRGVFQNLKVKRNFTKDFVSFKIEFILLCFFLFFSYWQLIGFPQWLSYVTLLGQAGANRTLIISGPLLIILSLKLLSRMQLNVSRTLISLGITTLSSLFFGLVFSNNKASVDYVAQYDTRGIASVYAFLLGHDDWLAFIFYVALLATAIIVSRLFLNSKQEKDISSTYLLKFVVGSTIVLPNIFIWGFFNPIYSADKIFAISATPAAVHSQEFFALTDKFVILPNVGPTGILSTLSIRTPQGVAEVPPIEYWKNLLGKDRYTQYESILNRYAYITVADVDIPNNSISPDVIQIPKKWFLNDSNYIVPEFSFNESNFRIDSNVPKHKIVCNKGDQFTQVDSLVQNQDPNGFSVTISGWLRDSEIRNYIIQAGQPGNSNLKIDSAIRQTRFDVLNAINFPSAVSGYTIKLSGVKPNTCVNLDFYRY